MARMLVHIPLGRAISSAGRASRLRRPHRCRMKPLLQASRLTNQARSVHLLVKFELRWLLPEMSKSVFTIACRSSSWGSD